MYMGRAVIRSRGSWYADWPKFPRMYTRRSVIWSRRFWCARLEEASPHVHTKECYETQTVLSCGLEELHSQTDTEGLPEGTELPSETESVEETGQTTEEALTDSTELPEKTEAAVPEGLGDITLTAESGNYVITVVASKNAFPDVTGTLSLQVTQLEESSPENQTAQRLVEGNGA